MKWAVRPGPFVLTNGRIYVHLLQYIFCIYYAKGRPTLYSSPRCSRCPVRHWWSLILLCNNPDYGNQTVHLDQVILIKHILCFCQTSFILFQVRSGIIYAHKQAEHISTYLSLPCVIRLYLWILRWQRGVDLRQAVGILLFVLYATLERSPSTIADLICLFQY